MGLFSAAERFASLDHSAIVFAADQCLHTQDRFSTCAVCHNLCPVEAIEPGKPPKLDGNKCQSCLACLTACPVGAYSADDEVASLLNAVTHLEGGTLELVCERNTLVTVGISGSSTGIRVRGCLAGLGSGAYLALASFGFEQVLVRMDACASCAWGTLPRLVETQVSRATKLLEVWGKSDILKPVYVVASPVVRPLWEAKNPPLSRRDLFLLAARQGQRAIARSMEDGQTAAGRHPGRDRQRILGAIAHLSAPEQVVDLLLDDTDFAFLSVSDTCTACSVCARACPTGALQFDKDEDKLEYKLIFSARKCVDCDICVHVCAPSSISVNHTPTYAQVFIDETVTLHEGGMVRCSSCGALTAALPGVSQCPLCVYRRTHPFGAMLPPGLQGIRPSSAQER